MANKDYIPAKEEDFNKWQNVFFINLSDFGAEDLMPPPKYHELARRKGNYDNMYAIAEDTKTRTSITIFDRQQARKEYESYIREIVKKYLINSDKLTGGQLIQMGLPIHKTTHTPAPVEKNYPWLNVVLKTIRYLTVEFGESETSKAKPEGQHGIDFVYVVSDEKPTDISQLTEKDSDTNTPIEIPFSEKDRGKTVWFAARWQNTRNEKGPWSPIYFAIIP
ncbi:MAG: hypothetical protein LBS54_06150 [Dysgonamonadaceae bacterium]|jgi:hypothetical protein|nr:hypothetical protein [Dysgonamonadaceae bacterium]